MKGTVLKTKVNVNRLKVYRCPDEHKESNEDTDAKSEKNEEDAKSKENETRHEENRSEGGSNEENGRECVSNGEREIGGEGATSEALRLASPLEST